MTLQEINQVCCCHCISVRSYNIDFNRRTDDLSIYPNESKTNITDSVEASPIYLYKTLQDIDLVGVCDSENVHKKKYNKKLPIHRYHVLSDISFI